MKVGDWVIVENCNNVLLAGKVSRILDPNTTNPHTSFKTNASIWDPKEGDFEHCLKEFGRGYGWSAKVRPLTLLERELYEL